MRIYVNGVLVLLRRVPFMGGGGHVLKVLIKDKEIAQQIHDAVAPETMPGVILADRGDKGFWELRIMHGSCSEVLIQIKEAGLRSTILPPQTKGAA